MLEKKLNALKKYLVEEKQATAEELNDLTVLNSFNKHFNTFEIIGNEYKVFTDAEADEAAFEEIKDILWAFDADFIINHSRIANISFCERKSLVETLQKLQRQLCENANLLVMALIDDIDDFVENAIETDGRGHFLSYYDGRENKIDDFYIYRTN